jgi:poly-gamma-glutamate synthesis protein (capsule biosynthesis protein)
VTARSFAGGLLALAALALVSVARAADPAPRGWTVTGSQILAVGESGLPVAQLRAYLEPGTLRTSSVLTVGDVIPHGGLVDAAAREDGHDFDPVFGPVSEAVSAAELAIANLETPVAGEDLGITGYPLFNAPEALIESLRDAGFDAVSTANNHAMDRRESGVRNTIEALQRVGLRHAGTAAEPTPGGARAWFDLEVGRAALLSYTFSTNGIMVPPARPWLVNHPIDEDSVVADIQDARSAGADLVLLALHWGEEYRLEPTAGQVRLARVFAEAGADAIVGHHPHVLQRAEVWTLSSPEGQQRHTLVLYSLGNFVSNQRAAPRDAGVMIRAEWIRAPALTRPQLSRVGVVPTWVDAEDASGPAFRILSVAEGVAACQGQSDAALSDRDCERLVAVGAEAEQVFPGAP